MADRQEESVGNSNKDGKGEDKGEINIVVRQEESERKDDDWEGSTSEAQANNDDDVAERKEEEGIVTNMATASEEGQEVWNVTFQCCLNPAGGGKFPIAYIILYPVMRHLIFL